MNITTKKLLVALMLLLLTSCGAAEVEENSDVTPVVEDQNMDVNSDNAGDMGSQEMDNQAPEAVEDMGTDTSVDMGATDVDMGADTAVETDSEGQAISIGGDTNQ